MRNLLGFDGIAPYSIIYWQLGGENQSKTVCYTDDEEKKALERFCTIGDFYSTYDKAIVNYGESNIEYDQVNQHIRGA
ncbi:hypothetical protein ABES21_24335 [Peribacillus frigoritolerans]|uniref:hypothetical protein n=1 Tax=Peribacillus frigoritolerans TaxID=450367 RepID=UPI003D2CD301